MSQADPLPPLQFEIDFDWPTEYRIVHRLELDREILKALRPMSQSTDSLIDRLAELLSIVGSGVITRIATLEAKMSKLSDAVDAISKSVDDALARGKATVDALTKQVDDLKAQLAAGGLSQAEEDAIAAKLTDLQGKIDAIDPTDPATVPTVPTPTPTPTDGGSTPAPPSDQGTAGNPAAPAPTA